MRIVGLAAAVLALAAPAAHAMKSASPTSYDFGALPIGTTSVERTFTLTATCNPSFPEPTVPCMYFEYWLVQLSAIGDFAIAGDNCPDPPAFLSADSVMFSRSCTVRVTFTPTAYGPRSGTLVTGGGPNVALSGSAPTLVVTQPPPAPKRCKKPKKRSASAAKKKCKKPKKG